MSSFSPPSSLTAPLQSRRNNPSTSWSTGLANYVHSPVSYSSLPPHSLAPVPPTRRDEDPEWQTGHDNCNSPSRYSRPEHYESRPLPSLMTKFTAHTLQNDATPSYNPSPFSYVFRLPYDYTLGDSAISDSEEYDLESMDIHIRETYFTTSAERGRWLSSPIPPRMQSQATPPIHWHTSPIKSRVDASPLNKRVRRHKIKCSVDAQILMSPSEDCDQGLSCSSPLPPSSPLISPISSPTFLSGDFEDNFTVEHCSSSDECQSLMRTPELSVSLTPCTSPVESMRTPSPRLESATISALRPAAISCPTGASLSRHTSSCSPKRIALDIRAPGITDFDTNDMLSPLSQFELELPEAEPAKQPLSDAVNKPCPRQHPTSLVAIDPVRTEDGSSSTQSLKYEKEDTSLEAIGGAGYDKIKPKRRNDAGARRSRKRAIIRSGGQPLRLKREQGTESRLLSPPEPPSKKTKLSHCGGDLKDRTAKATSRQKGSSKAKLRSRSTACPTVESRDAEAACPRDRAGSKALGRPRVQQSSPTIMPLSVDEIDVEFRSALTGMLIEAFATSRATSMDASALYLVLTQTHPHLTERSKGQLLIDIAVVLEAGRARCGMFEKVDGSGETRHKALESRWFYVPDKDEDPERATLISAIMPRQKRNETKKYKQYYYRPLDKISRWDPEDAP